MQIIVHNLKNGNIAEVTSDNIILGSVQDALDIMADIDYQTEVLFKIIFHEVNIHADFFDLKTQLAGEVLQKFVNYSKQVAIVGDFEKYSSKSLQDFIYESNKGRHIFFVKNTQDAIEKLIG